MRRQLFFTFLHSLSFTVKPHRLADRQAPQPITSHQWVVPVCGRGVACPVGDKLSAFVQLFSGVSSGTAEPDWED